MSTAPDDATTDFLPHVAEPGLGPTESADVDFSSASDSSSSSVTGDERRGRLSSRPRLGSRKSSGTMVVSRDTPNIVVEDEEYDEGDARTMSPRRSSEEIEKMGQEARQALIDQAKMLQQSLLEIVERVETVRTEHEKLEGGNKFLQSYIGELMATSKITSTGAAKAKGKGRTK